MLKNYALIALRRIAREKIYVLINVVSLSLGIASFVLLGMYLRSELTYDQHYVNHERVYRIITRFISPERGTRSFAFSPTGLGPLLTQDYPALGTYARLIPQTPSVLRFEDRQRVWEDTYFADSSVFEVLSHEVIWGDAATALDAPQSIAVSESFARFYFGEANPIGKSISSGTTNFTVTLVFRDPPENSHLRYSLLYSMNLMQHFDPGFVENYQRRLFNVDTYTYLKVPPTFSPGDFEPLFQDFFNRYLKERSRELNRTLRVELQPLTSVHFGEKLAADQPVGNIFYVYGFASVALFVLIVACINYVNLATARATKRGKEVGMRLVLGATRGRLVAQFLIESLVLASIAAVLGILVVLAVVYASPLGELMGKNDLGHYFGRASFWAGVVALTLIVALIAGLYPAIHLSGASPLSALTQTRRSWKTGLNIRQVLVFVQLAISIAVIACVLLMMSQMRFIRDMPLGFDKSNRIIVTLRGYDLVRNLAALKNEVRSLAGVVDLTTIDLVPGTGHSSNLIRTETNKGDFERISLDGIRVGLNFTNAMRVAVVRGRGFSEETPSDAAESVLVNETFVKHVGWDEPIGKGFYLGRDRVVHVVGVVEDFHYSSLHNAIGPLLIQPVGDTVEEVPEAVEPMVAASMIVAVDDADRLGATVESIRDLIRRFDSNFEFEPQFLDTRLAALYQSDSNLMRLTSVFAAVCIALSLIGLFGVALFSTEQRTKEIGIRRVLGASESGIVVMLSKGPLILSLLAAIPATAAGYYAIERWSNRFAYRAEFDWSAFIIATLVVAVVALAAVAVQALVAARNDPMRALRYE